MSQTHLVAPSLLAADFLNLERDLEMINNSEADWLHIDIMDGRFVPNISFGMDITKKVASVATKPLDVHLMIVEPEKYISAFRDAGAEIISVHVETCPHLHRTIQQIQDTGAKAGVVLNPHTPISAIENVLEDIDLVLLMSVNPGFGGQKFIYNTLVKLRNLKSILDQRNLSPFIEIDGGVGLQNAESLLREGANVLVAGSSVFKSEDPSKTISLLKSIERERVYI
ncbi:MAG: ribulose-phosphate 3-epimerase [Bacteroidia bacterium]|nr:ribulose-phosphate 3-epimerase [Bacteroidia bacterium]